MFGSPDPDIERTRALHATATKLCADAYFPEKFSDTFWDYAGTVMPFPAPVIWFEIDKGIEALYQAERFKKAPAPFHASRATGLEGARYRDELNTIIVRHNEPDETGGIFLRVMVDVWKPFCFRLPKFAHWKDDAKEPDDDAIKVSLIEAIDDVPTCVEHMIAGLSNPRRDELKLLDGLYDRVFENIKRTSGVSALTKVKDMVLPTKSKLAPLPLVHAYLGGTPLLDPFLLQIDYE